MRSKRLDPLSINTNSPLQAFAMLRPRLCQAAASKRTPKQKGWRFPATLSSTTRQGIALSVYHLMVVPAATSCSCVLPLAPMAPELAANAPGWCWWPYRYWMNRPIGLAIW